MTVRSGPAIAHELISSIIMQTLVRVRRRVKNKERKDKGGEKERVRFFVAG